MRMVDVVCRAVHLRGTMQKCTAKSFLGTSDPYDFGHFPVLLLRSILPSDIQENQR